MVDVLQLLLLATGVAVATVAVVLTRRKAGKATKEDYELLRELLQKEELRVKALEELAEDEVIKYIVERPHVKARVAKAMEEEMNRAVKSLLMASLRELYLSALRERLLFYILSFIGGAGTGIILAQVVFRGGGGG